MIKSAIRKFINFLGYDIKKYHLDRLDCSIDELNIETANDPAFLASVQLVKNHTLLDTPRLANLWQLARLTDPNGAIIEIGSYKGGGALHLANCCPSRTVYVCDTFEGFKQIDSELDNLFSYDMFQDTSFKAVSELFKKNNKVNCEIIPGFFPQSCKEKELKPISFVHLDVDVYSATKESLAFISQHLLPDSMIVLDDYLRDVKGVKQAVEEFIAKNPGWRILPLFPGQGLMIKTSNC